MGWEDFIKLFSGTPDRTGYKFGNGIVEANSILPEDVTTFGLEKTTIPGSRGFLDSPTKPGWGMPALTGIGMLGQLYTGMQNSKIAKDQLAFQKQAWAEQMKNYGQERDYNLRTRNAANASGSGALGMSSIRPQQFNIG